MGAGPLSSENVFNESLSTALIAHMNEHNYCADGHHGIETSAASEESISVQVKSGYDLRGKRCSRCIIKNQTILHFKNVIKKLKNDLKTIKSLQVKSLTDRCRGNMYRFKTGRKGILWKKKRTGFR